MKAVAYSVRALEKEYFAKANEKKHEITLIANPLGMDTVHYAGGKEAIIMPLGAVMPDEVTNALCGMGIKYIIRRAAGDQAGKLRETAEQMIKDLDTAGENDRLWPVA